MLFTRSHEYKTTAKSLRQLKIACIADTFTLNALSAECDVLSLSAGGWKNEISSFSPDMLFIESAWEGKDGSWHGKVNHVSRELCGLCSYAKEHGIPVVFRNKEDPVYFNTFLGAAYLADFVFTTDADCVEKYKEALGCDRVYFLHFSASAELHNPVEEYEREDKFCFAGSYYNKYKERSASFDELSMAFNEFRGLDIYDRHYGDTDPDFIFPEKYAPMIKGTLSPSEIGRAYKGYNYGVNMNTVHDSSTMFARRVFELCASNTVVAGNGTKGMKTLLGNLTLSADTGEEMKALLEKYCSDEASYRKLRLAALRKALSENMCEDRLGFITEKVYGRNLQRQLPAVHIFSFCDTEEEKAFVQADFDSQTYKNRTLTFLKKGDTAEVTDGFAGIFSPKNRYGKNYITDLMLSLKYGDFDGMGKLDRYVYAGETLSIKTREHTYRQCTSIELVSGIAKAGIIKRIFTDQTVNGSMICTDEFNFCMNSRDFSDITDDMDIDCGASHDSIVPKPYHADYSLFITGKDFAKRLEHTRSIKASHRKDRTVISSALDEGKVGYIWSKDTVSISEISSDGRLNVTLNASGYCDMTLAVMCLDSDKEKIAPLFTTANIPLEADVPKGCSFIRFGLRIKGDGAGEIIRITSRRY